MLSFLSAVAIYLEQRWSHFVRLLIFTIPSARWAEWSAALGLSAVSLSSRGDVFISPPFQRTHGVPQQPPPSPPQFPPQHWQLQRLHSHPSDVQHQGAVSCDVTPAVYEICCEIPEASRKDERVPLRALIPQKPRYLNLSLSSFSKIVGNSSPCLPRAPMSTDRLKTARCPTTRVLWRHGPFLQ